MINKDFFQALKDLEEQKGINQEYFIESLESSLTSAYKKNFGEAKSAFVKLNPEKNTITQSVKYIVLEYGTFIYLLIIFWITSNPPVLPLFFKAIPIPKPAVPAPAIKAIIFLPLSLTCCINRFGSKVCSNTNTTNGLNSEEKTDFKKKSLPNNIPPITSAIVFVINKNIDGVNQSPILP